MTGNRSRLSLAFTVAALILVGFMAGYLARAPVERWAARMKTSIAESSRQRHLAVKYLGKPAIGVESFALDGTAFSLSDRKGKVVLMFFWASWCQYSRNELPGIQKIYDRYADRDDFEIIGISLDSDRAALDNFVRSHNIRWANVYEDGKGWNSASVRSYEVRAIPSYWIVDKEQLVSGAGLSRTQADERLSLLLEHKRRTVSAEEKAAVSGFVVAGGCTAAEAP